jgi:hypothetical protein
VINYAARTHGRPRYYANDHSRDVLDIDAQHMAIIDARGSSPALDVEGFTLVQHQSVQSLSGADLVLVNAPGLLRFSEKSGRAGSLNNSMPARFAHVDITDATARTFAAQSTPEGKTIRRHAHYNVWRAISDPPQDVPLAVCDARSVGENDLIVADAIFDAPDQPEWSFEGWVVAHSPSHRWHWFSNMNRNEALVFKTNDSDPSKARCVPHVAFDDPDCPEDAPPRISIEMRAIAYWFDAAE